MFYAIVPLQEFSGMANTRSRTKQLAKKTSQENYKRGLNFDLWKELPQALCLLVFAHLPIREIHRLCCLNKKWNQAISTSKSLFSRLFDEAHPTILCLFTRTSLQNRCLRVLDMKLNKWCTIHNPPKYRPKNRGVIPYLSFLRLNNDPPSHMIITWACGDQSFYAVWEYNYNPHRSSIQSSTTRYYISEYNKKEIFSGKVLNIKAHNCPFSMYRNTLENHTQLYACEGYLMILKSTFTRECQFLKEVGWLYDLATCVWTPLDNLPQLPPSRDEDFFYDGLLNSNWSTLIARLKM